MYRKALQFSGYWLPRGIITLVILAPFVGVLLGLYLSATVFSALIIIALILVMHIPISYGVTAGYHRMLTHRAFVPHWAVKLALLVLASMSWEGAAMTWAANHGKHHAFSDREGDPHNAAKGLFEAHMGWLYRSSKTDSKRYAAHLQNDTMVKVISATFLLWAVLAMAIPAFLGELFGIGWMRGLVWGGAVRMGLTQHITWSVNSICHTYGARPFDNKDRSRNNWIVGLLALGEGWHNNHHAFPRSALHGLRQSQFDPTAWLILWLEKHGLARDVQIVTADDIKERVVRGTANALQLQKLKGVVSRRRRSAA